jgi:GDP-4-dehydro-6-deoxy-D-mannose reductase
LINCSITQNILEICHQNSLFPDKILLIGSAAEYGIPKQLPIEENDELNPVNLYGLSKVIQTNIGKYYFNNYGLNISFARTFNILGQHLSKHLVFGSFVSKIKDAKNIDTIEVGNLNSRRDFLDVIDVINAYWKIIQHGKPGEIYNVCAGNSHKIGDLLQYLIKLSNKSISPIINTKYLKTFDVKDIYGDNQKLINHTNWKSIIPIKESLKKMLFHQ